MSKAAVSMSFPKYDWDMAFVLYCGGSTYDQILAHPQFRSCPKPTLVTKANRDRWAERAKQLARLPQANAIDNAAKVLKDKLVEEGIKHQSFMLSELQRERRVFEDREKDPDKQLERLQALEKIDNLARKVSKLDDEKPVNAVTANFAFLTYLQTNTHRGSGNANTGILRSNNAIVDDAVTLDFTDYGDLPEAEAREPAQRAETDRKAMPAPGSLFGSKPV